MARGGKRDGAGRKTKFDGASATMAFRVPEHIKEYLRDTDWNWRDEFVDLVEAHIAKEKGSHD